MLWTEERIELVRNLWLEGVSASVIAGRLGGTTRNAVIGKVCRLGLPGRSTRVRIFTRPKPQSRTPKSTPKIKVQKPWFSTEPLPPVDPNERGSKTLLELEPDDCRWPIGDPQHEAFRFCGRGKVPGTPYCLTHAARAYEPATGRSRQRPMQRLAIAKTLVPT